MKTVHKSVLLWHTPQQMFDLVSRVDKYHEFLPWCHESTILNEDPQGMTAQVGMSMAGFKKSFTTRNRHDGTDAIHMTLVDGPFSKLEGTWRFAKVGEGDQSACKVVFDLHYAFSSTTVAMVVGPVFDKIANNLVDAFVKRADEVYGA